ncbi:MAG: DUF3467 domain-containing protein [Phycisphaeraceae bacterium]|nr:MAG: DUF3467 domain-containing protein [Phycisphaeraceae bacterium]
MAENAGQGEQRQIQLRVDESKMTTTYANTIRTSTAMDEVILDFGLNLPSQGQGGEPMLVFHVGSRVVMNWAGAKRLAMSLVNVVRQYEQANGEIQIQPRQSGAPAGGQGGGQGGGGPRLVQ